MIFQTVFTQTCAIRRAKVEFPCTLKYPVKAYNKFQQHDRISPKIHVGSGHWKVHCIRAWVFSCSFYVQSNAVELVDSVCSSWSSDSWLLQSEESLYEPAASSKPLNIAWRKTVCSCTQADQITARWRNDRKDWHETSGLHELIIWREDYGLQYIAHATVYTYFTACKMLDCLLSAILNEQLLAAFSAGAFEMCDVNPQMTAGL